MLQTTREATLRVEGREGVRGGGGSDGGKRGQRKGRREGRGRE